MPALSMVEGREPHPYDCMTCELFRTRCAELIQFVHRESRPAWDRWDAIARCRPLMCGHARCDRLAGVYLESAYKALRRYDPGTDRTPLKR